MTLRQLLLLAVLGLAPAGPAIACSEPPKADFRKIVTVAPTIFTFQLTSAYLIQKPLDGGGSTEYVVGLIRVIEPLKGNADAFRLIRYYFRGCGATRMSVGQTYLVATSQAGPSLDLWVDKALLDLTLDFYHEESRRSLAVDVVKGIVAGEPVPEDFPRLELALPLVVYPAPPPPADWK
jgi:hypothetical protein